MRYKILLTMVSMLLSTTAWASHYDMTDVELTNVEVTRQLIADGVNNTEDLLALLQRSSERAAFAKKYNIAAEDVEVLAKKLELMQIIGVGPKAATLMQLAGIDSLATLTKSDANILLDALLKANREHAITGIQPDLTVVKDWIEKAKKVTHHLN